ncbi:hypothetical protein GQ457_08G016820 [Hibiscus cannabinus]
MVDCDTPITLERHGSPVAMLDQRATKKGRNQEVDAHETDVSMMEAGDTLNGTPRPMVDDLDVEVLEEDVLVDNDGLMPKISFSKKVHCSIDQKLTNSVVIRLLGRTIGYRTLLNIIELLWKPRGEIRLIDLDNDYYLVRFALAEDCEKVLTGGPWVIYGSYVTVQPWIRNFSTSADHPSRIMVWVRLPRLPYRYYTKSLFRHIVGILGNVVRIDYNTDVASWGRFARLAVIVDLDKPLISGIIIDGQRQPVEYEGLPSICYGCGKYGHSKEVCGQSGQKSVEDRVRGDRELNKEDLYGNGGLSGRASGSRFSALSQLQEHDIIGSILARRKAINPPHAESKKERDSEENEAPSPQKQDEVARQEHTYKEVVATLSRNTFPIASSEQVTMVDTSLSKESHLAVQVGAPRARERSGRILPFSIIGNGENKGHDSGAGVLKKGVRTKKRDPRTTSRVSLAGLVENLVTGLDTVQSNIVQQASDLSDSLNGAVEAVQWRENTTFDPPDMFVVMESRISGSKADGFLWWYMGNVVQLGRPWAMGGDFNAIGNSIEREGSSRRCSGISSSFTKFLFDSGLVDMGYNGPTFTWKRGNLSQRLDRGLCNDAWYDLFPNFEVFHLQSLGSDHCPIIIDTICQRSAGYSRPFRFLSAWNDHSNFQSMLKALWNTNSSMGDNIARFQHDSREWNETIFGHIGRRKSLLLARIKGIERALAHSTSLNLLQLEGDLKKELDLVLEQEEHMWQKSRNNWIAKGDLHMLQMDDDSWCSDSTQLRVHACRFFQKLFTSDQPHWEHFWHDNWLNFDNPLAHICEFARPLAPASVASFVFASGQWDWVRLSSLLPQQVLKRIAALPPPNPALGTDTLGWRWEENKRFTTRSAYRVLCPRVLENSHSSWRIIWALQALLMNFERTRHHMSHSGICRLCNREDEDVLHVLRGYQRPRSVWLSLLPPSVFPMFLSLTLKEWVLANINPHGSSSCGDPKWPIRFVVLCWLLWKRRCGLILDAAADFTEGMKSVGVSHDLGTVVAPKWTCPRPEWVKINADGVTLEMEMRLRGRSFTVLMAELWAFHDALSMAWSRGFRRVVLETDNLEASKIVTGGSVTLVDNSLVIAICNLLSYNWEVEVRYIVRSANGVADSLARMFRGAPIRNETFAEPPLEAVAELLHDLSGL